MQPYNFKYQVASLETMAENGTSVRANNNQSPKPPASSFSAVKSGVLPEAQSSPLSAHPDNGTSNSPADPRPETGTAAADGGVSAEAVAVATAVGASSVASAVSVGAAAGAVGAAALGGGALWASLAKFGTLADQASSR